MQQGPHARFLVAASKRERTLQKTGTMLGDVVQTGTSPSPKIGTQSARRTAKSLMTSGRPSTMVQVVQLIDARC